MSTIASPLSIARRCALLEVSRSGYYASQRRGLSPRTVANQQLVAAMRRIHAEVDRSYGGPRMQEELVARVCKYTQVPALREQASSRTRLVV
jgi:hypothetical protein